MVLGLAGCSGGSEHSTPQRRSPPKLELFLTLPVATPTACPSGVAGSASGRRSPWVGHVDISVYLAPSAGPATIRSLGDRLRHTNHVAAVYYESADDAYAEYQRLYTCSAAVPRSAVPASYRFVVDDISHSERDALVRQIVRMPGVRDVACDPSDPCTTAATG